MTSLTRPLQRSTTGRYAVLYVGDRRPIIVSLLPGDVIAFREYRRRQVARILAERARLLASLRDLGVTAYESRGNFVAFDAAAHPGQAVGLVGEVRARGVVIRAMDEGIVRVSVGTPAENDAARAAIAAVRSATAAAV